MADVDPSNKFRLTRFHKSGDRAGTHLTGYREPVEAVDAAENWLDEFGVPSESFVEIRFNGNVEPHYRVFLLDGEIFGIQNTGQALWPISYQEGYGHNMDMPPSWWENTGEGPSKEQEGEDGKHKRDDDADSMEMGGEDDGDEDDTDDENSDDDEEGSDDPADENEDDDKKGSDEKEKPEMPRVKLFAKFRAPTGWRKRAETDEDKIVNTFEFRVGVLDERYDWQSNRHKERDNRLRVVVRENEDNRTHVQVTITVPEGVEFEHSDYGNKIIAMIPVQDVIPPAKKKP